MTPVKPGRGRTATPRPRRSGAAARAGLDQAEPLGHHQRVVVDRGGGTKERGHALAAEEVFVCSAPFGGVSVATPLGPRVVVIDHADRDHTYLGKLDDRGRLAR